MSEARWDRIKELFGQALELPAGQREAFLEAETGGDRELLAEILALLEADREDEFLVREEVADSIVGQRFGDYLLLEELGSGGTGIVYRARQEGLDREVALKVMPHHLALDTSRVDRFRREAKAAAGLRHPGIAPIFDYGSHRDATGNHHYFSMELVPGHDLARELELQASRKGLLPPHPTPAYWTAVAQVIRRCAEALAHAHGAGVVHRDVKPNNIVLEPSGAPRLVDFGLARDERLGSITVTDLAQGTPYYMSPEQAQAVADAIDERTDIYSLGVVFYELLARVKPFTGRTSRDVLNKIVVREPAPLSRVASRAPRDLAIICAKAMEKRPEDRYPSASELAADLGRFLGGEPIQARPPGVLRLLARRTRPWRTRLYVGGAVLLTLAATWSVTKARAWYALPELRLQVLFAEAGEDLDGHLAAGGELSVHAIPLDPYLGTPIGPSRDLGAAALDGFRLPEGTWRVRAKVGAYAHVDLDRHVRRGSDVRPLRARFLPVGKGPELLDVEAGLLEFMPLVAEREGLPREDWRRGLSRMSPSITGRSVDLGTYGVELFEASFGRFRAYLAESGDPTPVHWSGVDLSALADDLPVMLVTYHEAQAFAEWYGMRLPFVPELEFATRGSDWRSVPWESAGEENLANVAEHVPGPGRGAAGEVASYAMHAEPVDSRPEAATPEGLHHGLGNLAEWTFSRTAIPVAGGKVGPGEADIVITYGGSWSEKVDQAVLPLVETDEVGGELGKAHVGFRCVRSR